MCYISVIKTGNLYAIAVSCYSFEIMSCLQSSLSWLIPFFNLIVTNFEYLGMIHTYNVQFKARMFRLVWICSHMYTYVIQA